VAVTGSPRPRDEDPYVGFCFSVMEMGQVGTANKGGRELAGFSEVTGLTLEAEVETFWEGGRNDAQCQLIGPTKFPAKLVLKRGISRSDTLWSWYQEILRGRITRKTLKVKLKDSKGADTQWEWTFLNACPVKWTGPQFRADQGAVAFEAVDLIHDGLSPVSQ
jgi:phage tail-like protein